MSNKNFIAYLMQRFSDHESTMNSMYSLILCLLPISLSRDDMDTQETNLFRVKKPPATCDGELGCFPVTDDFTRPLVRPISLTPSRRDEVKTRILLYTKLNPNDAYQMFAWNIKNFELSPFNSSVPVKFLIPGYSDSRLNSVWLFQMISALLSYGSYNVFLVEWRNIIPVIIAASDTRVVGAEIANFIAFLVEFKFTIPEDIHVIGHSYGAQIAGYAGQATPNLGRITGLDPGRPYFEGLPPNVRLNSDDALFVDIIHTDFNPLFSLGFAKPIGHVDFYLNGASPQPGCFMRDRLLRGIEDGIKMTNIWSFVTQSLRYSSSIGCSHQRAHEIFLESITSDQYGCNFVGLRCPDYDSFAKGKCTCHDSTNACVVLGYHADEYFDREAEANEPEKSRWFVRTAATRPYCLHQYQIIIQLGSHKLPFLKGIMYLKLHYLVRGMPGIIELKITPPNSLLSSALRIPQVLTLKESIGQIRNVSFAWFPIDAELSSLYLYSQQYMRIPLKYIRVSAISAIHNNYLRFRHNSSTQYFCHNLHSIKSFKFVKLKASNHC